MINSFEGIRILTINCRRFNRGSAFTIPGLGIFVGLKQINNTDLLRHEFGHILQRRQKGILFYWTRIVPVSLWSAFITSINKQHIHMNTWSEWSANSLSYLYFNRPSEWDFIKYPISPRN